MFDFFVLHNINCNSQGNLDEVLKIDEIIQALRVGMIASYDPLVSVTEWALTYIAEDANLQSKILENLNKNNSDESTNIFESEIMEKLTLESLRLCHPSHVVFPRTIIKDCTINGLQFKRNDLVTIVIGSNNRRPDWYPNPRKFDIERNDLNKPSLLSGKFIPFSFGKKSCVGKILGEILIKIVLAETVKIYDVSLPEDFKRYIILKNASNQVESCKLSLKMR